MVNTTAQRTEKTSQFVTALKKFEQLGLGDKAKFRRAGEPDDLRDIGAFYSLLPKECRDENEGSITNWTRVMFFFPWFTHRKSNGKDNTIGTILRKYGITERRINVIIKSDPPNNMIHLRKAAKQIFAKNKGVAVDWESFGNTLFYWGASRKRELLKDYFFAEKDEE